MVIALIISVPILILGVGFLVLHAYYLGLKHNIQIQNNEPLEKPVKIENPITAYVEKKEAVKVENVFEEWINGKKEG